MTLGEIEQRKLTANYFNTIASALLITGAVVPLVTVTYGLPGPGPGLQLLLGTAGWLRRARAYIGSHGAS